MKPSQSQRNDILLMAKAIEQSLTFTNNRWKYWVKLMLAMLSVLLLTVAGTILFISYQQTMNYLHPPRQTSSGEYLRVNGVEFQEVELLTDDNVRLSAWYTPPKNGAVILV